MTTFNRIVLCGAALAATTALSGCLRGTTADPAALAEAVILGRDARSDLIMQQTSLPQTGGATYNGFAAGMIKQNSNAEQVGLHWVGDASFDVAFAANDATFSGEIGNILAKDGVNQNDVLATYFGGTQQEVEDFLTGMDGTTGSIQITNGQLAPTSGSPTSATSDIDGSFTHSGSTYALSGNGRGFFFGANGEGLGVNAETNDGLSITENGTTRAGDFAAWTVAE